MTELDLLWGDKPRVGPAYTEAGTHHPACETRVHASPSVSEQRKNPL